MELLDFSDVAPKELAVKNLMGNDYVLRSAKGDAVLKFQAEQNAAFETITDEDTGKRVSRRVKPNHGVECFFVSLCLFDTASNPVPQAVVNLFPPDSVRRLFQAAHEMTWPDEDLASLQRRRAALDREIARLEAAAALKNA